ncbi:hypothetical protein F5Y16DRAFT_410192 [Xylariaceae sp. FL0255]|nr:hypothetical protein F5Y16DRAFT_410192 [Xylariaceae sp. FL0255]
METVFDGLVMRQCRDEKREFHILEPKLVPRAQDQDTSEPAATMILNIWTNTVVNTALLAVKDMLNPVNWAPQSNAAKSKPSKEPTRTNQAPQTNDNVRKTRPNKGPIPSHKRTIVPDASGLPISGDGILGPGGSPLPKPASRLPKEIKSGSTWLSSEKIGRPIGKTKLWIDGRPAAPLRQIYQQCIDAGSRYGCILTTREAFIVRIGPWRGSNLYIPPGTSRTKDQLKHSIEKGGLLEYVSIPWEAHRSKDESLEQFKTMTMNLAIWFQHILAGNNHEFAWEYKRLVDEKLKTNDKKEDKMSQATTKARQESKQRLVVEIPTMGSFTSIAHSDGDCRETIPTPSGPETMSYLNRSFATESDIGEPSMIGGRKRRYLPLESEVTLSSPKRRNNGRPPKDTSR